MTCSCRQQQQQQCLWLFWQPSSSVITPSEPLHIFSCIELQLTCDHCTFSLSLHIYTHIHTHTQLLLCFTCSPSYWRHWILFSSLIPVRVLLCHWRAQHRQTCVTLHFSALLLSSLLGTRRINLMNGVVLIYWTKLSNTIVVRNKLRTC